MFDSFSIKKNTDNENLMLQDIKDALKYAFLLLRYRPRSTNEMCQKLRLKGYDQQVIDKTIEELTAKKELDDLKFAKLLISDFMANRPLGKKLLRYKLKQKGISEEIVGAALEDFDTVYSQSDNIYNLAKKRIELYHGLPSLEAKHKLYGYLLRKGFDAESVESCLKKLFNKEIREQNDFCR